MKEEEWGKKPPLHEKEGSIKKESNLNLSEWGYQKINKIVNQFTQFQKFQFL
ncbi:MAG: hypothetical protein CM15mV100_030 [uncultured marine virus]|nr:MAG: hypothetical protein CM15mV100_030 [uncultured marine virus]